MSVLCDLFRSYNTLSPLASMLKVWAHRGCQKQCLKLDFNLKCTLCCHQMTCPAFVSYSPSSVAARVSPSDQKFGIVLSFRQKHRLSWYSLVQWCPMIFNDLLWSSMISNDLLWSSMIFNDFWWSTMIFHNRLWSLMISNYLCSVFFYVDIQNKRQTGGPCRQ